MPSKRSVFWDDLAKDMADPSFAREYQAARSRILESGRIAQFVTRETKEQVMPS